MRIESKLYKEVIKLIEQRYPTGWGGAAAVALEDETVLTSVAPEVINDASNLCMETGSILEAHKLNKRVTHSLCVVRDDENSQYKVLTPCGICQERFFYWGSDVKVAVSVKSEDIVFKTLAEVQPYHWSDAYDKEELFSE